ncbi:MAG: hypothetical protein LUQ16_04550 [Methanomassiliicoccales archaeon]|jgi:hypothetical protein|nr:hypothetical protein [Methanomassiliicoccales archaeon]MDD1755383.1 hypothetical protein [Methanomassiliicoccales archaeon]
MEKKERSKPKGKAANAKGRTSQSKADRTTRIMNAITNTSVVLMSVMMGGFAKAMVEATGEIASGMAGSVDPEEGERINQEVQQKLPEIDGEMKSMVSEMRKDLYAQVGEKRKEIEPLLSDPVFDLGPKIVDRYEFGLPRLTEELDDASLVQYTRLLVDEDPNFSRMFQELTDWINTLPKPPEKSVGD